MSLATRCPHCNTLFKVTLGQLQLHEGQIRCGQCQRLFSGVEHLTSADSDAWESLKLSLIQNSKAQAAPQASASEQPLGTNPPRSTEEPGFLSAPALKARIQWRDEWAQTPKPLQWMLISLSLLIGLQLGWWQKQNWVGAVDAWSRAISQSSSEGLQWAFARPASASLVLEGSGLSRISDTQLQLDITLRNTSALPSRWPHLRVDLTDTQGLVLASRVLAPADYLMRSDHPQKHLGPMPGGALVELLAFLNLHTLNSRLPGSTAAGFKLQVFDQSPEPVQTEKEPR